MGFCATNARKDAVHILCTSGDDGKSIDMFYFISVCGPDDRSLGRLADMF